MKKRIVTSSSDNHLNHRGDFETCPHCDKKFKSDIWDKAAHTLIRAPHCYKSGCVAIMSECPKCFENSWVHHKVDMFEYDDAWPQKWKEKATLIGDMWKLAAVRALANSLCGKCVHLTSCSVEFHAYRQCKKGMGCVETECDIYQPL